MPIALTSDFPSTPNETVFTAMRARTNKPTIAWIPPFTDRNEERFARAKEQFAMHGFSQMEYCDIDEAADHAMLSRLATFDVVYLAGGDPLRFRRNIARVRIGERLRECLVAGCLIGVALFALFPDMMKGVYEVYDSLFGWRVVLLLAVIAAIPLRRRRRG